MKLIPRLLSILLLLCLTACGTVIAIRFPDTPATSVPTLTALPTQTAIPTATAVVQVTARTTANVNLRIAPNTNNTPIRVLLTGTSVTLIGRLSDNTWAQTIDGWIYTQNLSITGNINSLPIVNPATPEPTPSQEVRNKARISYNINGESVPDRAYLKAHLIRLCPTTVLVMNGMAYAVELEQALRACGTRVAHRTYSYYEGDEWVARSPRQIVDAWIAEGNFQIIRYSVNEASYGGNRSIQSFVASQVEVMRLAREAGITLICCNLAVGTWNVVDFQYGHYDALIRAINLYGHYLGLHEYTQTVLPFGVSQWPRECLLNRLCVQPANWPTIAQVPLAMTFDPVIRDMNYPRTYHFRRGDWFSLRADAIGEKHNPIWLTEWGWDSLADIKASIESLRSPFCVLDGKYLCDLRGVNTYENLFGWYYPQWTFAQAMCEQLKWGDSIYPLQYIGFNLFTWGINPMWLHTDFSGRENADMYELHACLETYAA